MKSLHSSQKRNGHDTVYGHSSDYNASRDQHRHTTGRNATERSALKAFLVAYDGPIAIIVKGATCSTEAANVPILVDHCGASNSRGDIVIVVFDVTCCGAFVVVIVAVYGLSVTADLVSVMVYYGLHILQVRQWCSTFRETSADLDVTRSYMPTRRDCGTTAPQAVDSPRHNAPIKDGNILKIPNSARCLLTSRKSILQYISYELLLGCKIWLVYVSCFCGLPVRSYGTFRNPRRMQLSASSRVQGSTCTLGLLSGNTNCESC